MSEEQQNNNANQLPSLVNLRSNRNVSQVDLNFAQKSKTIQSENWEMLQRVKESLESKAFSNFFTSSLAKLPNFKSPQELAKVLADQFIQNEIKKGKKREAKSAIKIQVPQPQTSDSLPALKTPQMKLDKNKFNPIRSKSRDKLRELEIIKEQEREKEQQNKENNKTSEKILKQKNKIFSKDTQRQKEQDKSFAEQPSPPIKLQKYIRHTLSIAKLQSPIPIDANQQPQPTIYSYFLGGGNNSELIKRVFDYRSDWHQTTNIARANFRWQQSNHGYKYFKLNWHKSHKELLNHFEFHPEISNKKNLLVNVSAACEILKLNPFDITPVTFAIDFTDSSVECNISAFYNFYNKNAPEAKQLNKQDAQNKLNEIKKKLRIAPSKEKKQLEFQMRDTFTGPDYLWLLKPTGLNRGRGIHVFQDIDNLIDLLIDYQYGYHEKQLETYKDENGQTQQKVVQYLLKTSSFVVQKYIEKPLLIKNRKFDIRVWVFLNTDLSCYFFKEGYIRMASEEYRTNDVENIYIHLTNNAIQQHSDKYGQQELGNQLSFDQVSDYFKSKIDFRGKIVEKMKEMAYFAMRTVATKINKLNRKFCMEIFGFDFFLDELFNIYLIEVNTNPCLEESSPLLQMLIPRMVDDAFVLTVDQIFPIQRDVVSKFPVTNYSDTENMWQLMGELTEIQG
ncbi:unnamed protein product (macronuclear) [Paramecium tetraurelia]|uniref:Tubulin-tyrosine ligase family protein n=1 Tax=Paramecium tetraurelia TaxID=5888 RepID=A0EEV1_PARTE|nr:uncharacterized protein GSPATT00026165001 [Paramecium tetraurelia]CAK93842.1 unnamed protein product [Paramecium tetraurelia]|eukprot:XP_001461215.1 hypothetical protein (macronuclear) [Paramecium tetraurelia strain d4-2]